MQGAGLRMLDIFGQPKGQAHIECEFIRTLTNPIHSGGMMPGDAIRASLRGRFRHDQWFPDKMTRAGSPRPKTNAAPYTKIRKIMIVIRPIMMLGIKTSFMRINMIFHLFAYASHIPS